jgi:hypothetical protein
MKQVIRQVAAKVPLEFQEIDVQSAAELEDKYGDEVPVLFVDGKKSFKYRVTAKELEKRLRRGPFAKLWGSATRGE